MARAISELAFISAFSNEHKIAAASCRLLYRSDRATRRGRNEPSLYSRGRLCGYYGSLANRVALVYVGTGSSFHSSLDTQCIRDAQPHHHAPMMKRDFFFFRFYLLFRHEHVTGVTGRHPPSYPVGLPPSVASAGTSRRRLEMRFTFSRFGFRVAMFVQPLPPLVELLRKKKEEGISFYYHEASHRLDGWVLLRATCDGENRKDRAATFPRQQHTRNQIRFALAIRQPPFL